MNDSRLFVLPSQIASHYKREVNASDILRADVINAEVAYRVHDWNTSYEEPEQEPTRPHYSGLLALALVSAALLFRVPLLGLIAIFVALYSVVQVAPRPQKTWVIRLKRISDMQTAMRLRYLINHADLVALGISREKLYWVTEMVADYEVEIAELNRARRLLREGDERLLAERAIQIRQQQHESCLQWIDHTCVESIEHHRHSQVSRYQRAELEAHKEALEMVRAKLGTEPDFPHLDNDPAPVVWQNYR